MRDLAGYAALEGRSLAHARPLATSPGMGEYRDRIDALDEEILRLLNERANLAVRIGRIKRATGQPVHAPEREADVLDHVTTLGDGPLDAEAIARLFRAIIAETRAAEAELAMIA
jgi:chorismate mutase-like protein